MLNIIEFNGTKSNKWLVYKHPNKQFNDKSKLVVGIGQVGLVVYRGKVEAIFENGSHTLNNDNLPFLSSLQRGVYGGNAPFPMVVYFINKTVKLDMLWGTNDPIQLLEPKFNVRVNVRARGQYGLRITNYQFLLTQLVGTIGANLLDFDMINKFFRGLINTRIKSLLSKEILNNKISLLDINMYLEELSNKTLESLTPDFEKYGMELINFYYESINMPEKDLDIINSILNRNAEFNILGDNRYQRSRGFDVLDSAAKNEGTSGGIASAGLGLGIGAGLAKETMQMTSDIKPSEANLKDCVKCGSKIKATSQFCSSCGSAQSLTCKNCNATLDVKSKFCSKCGTAVEGV